MNIINLYFQVTFQTYGLYIHVGLSPYGLADTEASSWWLVTINRALYYVICIIRKDNHENVVSC